MVSSVFAGLVAVAGIASALPQSTPTGSRSCEVIGSGNQDGQYTVTCGKDGSHDTATSPASISSANLHPPQVPIDREVTSAMARPVHSRAVCLCAISWPAALDLPGLKAMGVVPVTSRAAWLIRSMHPMSTWQSSLILRLRPLPQLSKPLRFRSLPRSSKALAAPQLLPFRTLP